MIVECVCTCVCHTEHKEWSPAVPCASCSQSQPCPWELGGCCGLFSTVQGQMHRTEMWKDCDHKGLGVLLHRAPTADRSTQLSVNGKSDKEEAAGNVKWKPDATASH